MVVLMYAEKDESKWIGRVDCGDSETCGWNRLNTGSYNKFKDKHIFM